jgi:hypothetical protein
LSLSGLYVCTSLMGGGGVAANGVHFTSHKIENSQRNEAKLSLSGLCVY